MAGTAPSQRQQAFADETVVGTVNTSPAFKTTHRAILMKAATETAYGRSLVAKGAEYGRAILGIPVTGTLPDGDFTYSNYDRWIESLMQGTWASDILIDSKDQNTFSIEDKFVAGNGGTNTYNRFLGVEAVAGSWKFKRGETVKFGMTFIGLGSENSQTTAKSGATYTVPAFNDVFSSGADMTALTFATFTLDCFSEFQIDVSWAGRELQEKITSDTACGISRGDITVKMKGKMYIEPNYGAMYNAARAAHSPFKVTVNLGQTTLQKYRFEITNAYFDANTPDWSGASGMLDVAMTGTYHVGTTSVLKITRALA